MKTIQEKLDHLFQQSVEIHSTLGGVIDFSVSVYVECGMALECSILGIEDGKLKLMTIVEEIDTAIDTQVKAQAFAKRMSAIMEERRQAKLN